VTRTHRIALLLAGSALIAGAQAASADVRISIGGGIRFGGAPVRAHWVQRHVHRPAVHIGGSIWIGGGGYYQPFAQPPPPPPPPMACNCEQPQTYYPIAPAPVGYATVAAPASAAEPLSRFGIGVFMGGVSVDGEHEGKDAGLVGQFRLTRGLILEGEVAKNELADGARVDRRIMAGLQLELRPQRRMTPYLAAAVGTTQVEIGDSWQDNQGLAEVGAGLRYRLSERFALFGDIRVGQRQLADQAATPVPVDSNMARVMPAADENYSRVRLGGMLTF